MKGLDKVTTIFRSIAVFLARIGGCRPDAIGAAPMSIALSSTLGALMILTSLNATCTAGYALFLAFDGSQIIAVCGGLCWGACVLCLDQALLLTFDKTANWKKRTLQLLIRVPFAIIIGITMSKPLVLRLADSAIQRELFRERQSDLKGASQLYATTTEVDLRRSRLKEAKAELTSARSRLEGEPDSLRYKAAISALLVAKDRRASAVARLEKMRKELLAQAGKEDPVIASRAQQAEYEAVVERKAVSRAELEMSRAADEFRANAASDLEKAQAGATDAARRQESAERLFDEKQNNAENEIKNFSKSDLLNRYRIFRLITDGNGPDAKSLSAFAFAADSLLILLELIPIAIKSLAPIDSLDEAQRNLIIGEKERFIYQDRIEGQRRMRAIQLEEALTEKIAEKIQQQLEKKIEQTDLANPTVASELTEMVRQSCKVLRAEPLDVNTDTDTDIDEDQAA